MGYSIKNNIKTAVMREATEGVYVAPATGGDYLQVEASGLDLSPTRELLERPVLGTGLGKINPRLGLKSVKGTIPVYMRAGSTASSECEAGLLLESLLGSKRSSSSIISGTGHTASVIKVASTANLKVGDVIIVKQAGAFHASPISSLVTNTSITLLVPCDTAPSDAVVLEAFTTYVPANTGHPSLSVSKYVEDAILEQATGCKVISMALENFITGKIASWKFGLEGLSFDRSLSSPTGGAPVFDTSNTPVILDAYIYQDGTKIAINDFTLTVTNTIGYIQDTDKGKTSSRITARAISGSINPYKSSSSVANFTKFNTNAPFSLFVTAHNPTGVTGEFKESVSFYLPNCLTTDLGEGDNAGVLTDDIKFSANTVDGSIQELYISIS